MRALKPNTLEEIEVYINVFHIMAPLIWVV